MRSFEISTELPASADDVWAHVTTPAGINGELMPLMRMTIPPSFAGASIDDLVVGERVGRCWVLMGGFLPDDYDDLTVAELGPGRRFLEQSQMLTQAWWQHERVVDDAGAGARITDRLSWRGRNRVFEALYARMVPVIFTHRHRRLRRHFS